MKHARYALVLRVSPRPPPLQRLLGHLLTTAQTGADPAAAARAGVAGGSGFRLAVLAVRGMAGLAEPVAVLEGQQVRQGVLRLYALCVQTITLRAPCEVR